MSTLLPAVELETAPNPTYSVIWMHGLGADGNDFVPVVPELALPAAPAVRFIFPHAPSIPVTGNNGYIMPAWYDIASFDKVRRDADVAGIRASREAIRAWIAHENAHGIPTSRIVLAGFSQGGAMAYITGLTHPEPLAGIVALSTYIPSEELLNEEFDAANANTPIFAAHGERDDVVALALGTRARDVLTQRQCTIAWHTYPMPHSVCLEEIADIGAWLRMRFAGQPA